MLQIGRCGEGFHGRVGKMFGKNAAEANAELFTGNAAGRARRIGAKKFKLGGFLAAEALDFEDDASFGLLFDAENAAREIAVARTRDERGGSSLPGASRSANP